MICPEVSSAQNSMAAVSAEGSTTGALIGPSVKAKLRALENRQREVASELAGLAVEPVRLHPNLATVYRQKVAHLQDLLANKDTQTGAIR